MTPDPANYQAVLTCRSCGEPHYVSKLAVPFRHWICYTKLGAFQRRCRTFNLWENGAQKSPSPGGQK